MTDETNYVIAIHRAVLIGRGNCFGIGIWLWFFDSHLKSASNNAKDKNSFVFFPQTFYRRIKMLLRLL